MKLVRTQQTAALCNAICRLPSSTQCALTKKLGFDPCRGQAYFNAVADSYQSRLCRDYRERKASECFLELGADASADAAGISFQLQIVALGAYCDRKKQSFAVVITPKQLPFTPKPIGDELVSSWLLRVAAANSVHLSELLQASKPVTTLNPHALDFADADVVAAAVIRASSFGV